MSSESLAMDSRPILRSVRRMHFSSLSQATLTCRLDMGPGDESEVDPEGG
jgi:hypothetical protein